MSHVSEVGRVGVRDSNIHVYSLYGLGFGSDVTVVVRLGEGLDRSGLMHRRRSVCGDSP